MQKLRENVQARYAEEFKAAGFFRRLLLRWRIAAEFKKERQKIGPSRYALYSSRAFSGK
jgi:hypothetical protein